MCHLVSSRNQFPWVRNPEIDASGGVGHCECVCVCVERVSCTLPMGRDIPSAVRSDWLLIRDHRSSITDWCGYFKKKTPAATSLQPHLPSRRDTVRPSAPLTEVIAQLFNLSFIRGDAFGCRRTLRWRSGRRRAQSGDPREENALSNS